MTSKVLIGSCCSKVIIFWTINHGIKICCLEIVWTRCFWMFGKKILIHPSFYLCVNLMASSSACLSSVVVLVPGYIPWTILARPIFHTWLCFCHHNKHKQTTIEGAGYSISNLFSSLKNASRSRITRVPISFESYRINTNHPTRKRMTTLC